MTGASILCFLMTIEVKQVTGSFIFYANRKKILGFYFYFYEYKGTEMERKGCRIQFIEAEMAY